MPPLAAGDALFSFLSRASLSPVMDRGEREMRPLFKAAYEKALVLGTAEGVNP